MPIREIREQDRNFFCSIMDEFYRTDAVIKPLSMDKIQRVCEDCIKGSSHVKAYIFEEEGTAFGYAVISYGYSVEAGGVCLWVEDLYIRAGHRGKGWGSAFFEKIIKENRGIAYRVRLEVEKENLGAVALYKKYGFEFLEYSQMIKEIKE